MFINLQNMPSKSPAERLQDLHDKGFPEDHPQRLATESAARNTRTKVVVAKLPVSPHNED